MISHLTSWTLALLLGVALLGSGCRTRVAGATIFARPAVRILPRAVERGDGEQVFVEGYEPRGDSFFIVVRVTPESKKEGRTAPGAPPLPWSGSLTQKAKPGE